MAQTIMEQAHAHYDRGVPTQIPLPERSLYFLLKEAAQNYPKQIAIDYYGKTWTYKELHREVEKAANLLYLHGIRRGDTVAIALPNCPQHIIAFYALMRIGATASEHNPLAPGAQIDGQLQKNGASAAIVWEKSAAAYQQIADQKGTVFTVDITATLPLKLRLALKMPVAKAKQKRETITAKTPHFALSWDRMMRKTKELDQEIPHAKLTDNAVILHTGGTSGTPKSVPLTHANLGANVNQNIFWVWKLHEGAEVFWSLLPYFHAFGMTFFLLCSVAIGGTQLMLPNFDVDAALAAHRRRPVTFFVGVPPMFKRIADAAKKSGDDLTSIKYAISGGMPLSAEIAQQWEDSTQNYLIEGYGMSETSPTMCGSPLNENRRRGTLGLPFPSTEIKLVDPQNPDREVEDGEPGEILVKGPQVFAGYLDDPEENKRVFHQGWLRTGDIATNQDGFLTMSDRLKELIISSGFNIYPSQIEEVFKQLDDVENCAAIGMPDPDSGEKLALVIVGKAGAKTKLTIDAIREFGETYLPHYALPKEIHFLESLPVSQLGKVLRRAVKEQITQKQEPTKH